MARRLLLCSTRGSPTLGARHTQRGSAADAVRHDATVGGEVAVLVAMGLTNAEIARRLVLVEGTVTNHLEHILRK